VNINGGEVSVCRFQNLFPNINGGCLLNIKIMTETVTGKVRFVVTQPCKKSALRVDKSSVTGLQWPGFEFLSLSPQYLLGVAQP
jgi:hypothetical protein